MLCSHAPSKLRSHPNTGSDQASNTTDIITGIIVKKLYKNFILVIIILYLSRTLSAKYPDTMDKTQAYNISYVYHR